MSLIEKKKTETRVQITTDMKCALINAIALSWKQNSLSR